MNEIVPSFSGLPDGGKNSLQIIFDYPNMDGIFFNDLATIEEILEAISKKPYLPHVIMVNVNIGPMPGVEVISKLKRGFPNIRPLVLSFEPDNMYAIEMLKAGAYEYIDGNMNLPKLRKTIRKLIETPEYFTDMYHNSGKQQEVNEEVRALFSAEEIQFIELNAQGISLWEIGEAMALSRASVFQHLKNIYEKLEVNGRADMVVYAVRRGLITLKEKQ